MKAEQVSFAAGEISPVLHARTDLTRYRIGLAELVNMIVLPQGGVTRRAGMTTFGTTIGMGNVKLIPFEYNTTDSVMLEFGNTIIRVWQKTSSGVNAIAGINGTPYTASEVKDLRYVQSGNVMFLTHKNHKPMMLRRNSLTSWTLEELPFRGGPWISGEEWCPGAKLRFSTIDTDRMVESIDGDVFSGNVAGSLIKVEYAVAPKTMELVSARTETTSDTFEVKGTLNVTTAGDWIGTIKVDRSADGGNTWVTIRQYVRTNTETQGQWDFTISETEDNILYRVRAKHKATTDDSGGDDSGGSGEPAFHTAEEGGHPDVEGGENYVWLIAWMTAGAAYYSMTYQGTDANGMHFYYNGGVKQTFYPVGELNHQEYGYYQDGYPAGYDENGYWIEEE